MRIGATMIRFAILQVWLTCLCILSLSGVAAEADLQTRLHDLSWADLSCLRQEPKGCAVLQDQYSCLSSKGKDEAPCLWCDGGPCLAGRFNRCESLPTFKGSEETATHGTVEVPGCEDGLATVFKKGRPEADMAPSQVHLYPNWEHHDSGCQEQLSRLSPVKGGCMSVQDMSTCLSSKDGSGNATWGYTPYKVAGEACVWCGGLPCTDANTALCMPYDLLMNGQGPHHNLFYAKHNFKVAEVKESKVVFPPSDLSCLSKNNKGCPSLLDAYDCLASADGRPDETIFGRKVHGQPCVWCNNTLCNERGAKCEPYDLQMNGEGIAFTTSYSKDPMVAQCKDGRVMPHFNVSKPVLNLPKPNMDKLECLTMKAGGCKTLTEKISCISSRDGSETESEGGLAIRGQPCVWCGGGKCTDDSDALCAAYEYLAQGAGKVFAQIMAVSTTVAECHEQEMQFSDADVECLKPAEKGCNMIRDSVTCTNSREERPYEYIGGFKVKGQPCVWCGGGQCHDGADTLCEPYDYALYGAGHAFHTKYSHGPFYKAFCNKDAQPGAEMLPADWQIHGMRMHVDCGKPFPVWAKVGQRCGFCKVLVPSIKEDYKTCKDYCASQGNLQCASAALGSISSCDLKEKKSCDYAFQVYEHGLCECSFESTLEVVNEHFGKALASPSKAEMQCLKKAETGCRAITDRLNCLSSMDDSWQDSVKGLKVNGEPCVWCGGVACTSKDPAILCEARDYLVNGKGLAFVHRHVAAEHVDVAKCQAPKRSFGNLGCLKAQEKGCNSIKDMDTCLSSLDGRPYDQVAGLQVEGQPCVWCGGVPCNSNNGNLCEPYDFALHGEGHAYDVNHAEDNYYTAACEAGQPVKHTTSTAAERAGIATLVDCGTLQTIWKGVGKTCGQCKVQVAIEAAKSYGNCSGYCQAQGLTCEKAYSSHLHSCDLRSDEAISCQQSFDSSGFLCQCAQAQAVPAPQVPQAQVAEEAQALYGQCGGKDWKGYTRCKAGAVCNVVDADFSQCVPSGTAKPGVRAEAPQSPLASTLSAAAPSLSLSLSLQDDLGSAPPAAKGASCANHPKCAALKLAGECCPNPEGVRLDCCSTGAFDTSSVVLDPAEAMPHAAPATLGAAPEAHQPHQPSEWWKIPKPSQEQLKCMPSEPKGCGSIKHKLMCLSRVDGRIGYAPHGLNVGGEPCVWCGGGPCTTYSDAVCEPYNWLVNGQGKAFASQNSAPATWLVAKCQDDRNSVFSELGCLRKSEIGCNHITEKHQCLASLDARPYVEVAGFKARAQPCVWCGGGTCHSNNGNLCEPYDFVMNGQGQAFKSNYGFNTYMVAECTQDGRVLPMSYPHADVERGLPTQVTCGEKVTWNGVGKVCGDCDVTVPNIFATFGNCNSYCAAQGGSKCLSAKKAFTHSCSAQPPEEYDLSCDSTFASGEFARCHCSASEKATKALVDQNANLPALPYGQCGGKDWTGIRRCQIGSTCFMINRWYSQCLPGAYSNPDQAAQAAKNAAEAKGQPIEDQAVAAGAAATKAASAAGQSAQSQATRAYVAAAGTAAIGGLARPQAHDIGEAAAHTASYQGGLNHQQANQVAEQAIRAGEAIVFGEDQSNNAAEIAGKAAANSAKDTGLSGSEQCQKAYHAALAFAKGSGKTPKQQAELAARVAQKAAFRAELTPQQQVQCVVDAAQASASSDGAFSDTVAEAMTHAGTVAAQGAGIDAAQVSGVVAGCVKATEDASADGLKIPQDVMDKCMTTAKASGLGLAAEVMATSGLLAPEAAQAARKCVYDAAIQTGKSPGEAAAASEAAARSVAAALARPESQKVTPEPVQRVGEDCWIACGKQSGLCAFCGVGNACCRKDESNPTKACQNIKTFSTWHHECVRPVHLPEDLSDVAAAVTEASGYEAAAEGGAVAGAAAAAGGHGDAAQAVAAGTAAAKVAKDEGLNTVNQVTVAYKAAENAGKEGGMTQYDADQTAQSVAEDVAGDSGMSGTEATAAAAAAAAVVHGLPLPTGRTPAPLQPPVLEPGPVILPAGPGMPGKPQVATLTEKPTEIIETAPGSRPVVAVEPPVPPKPVPTPPKPAQPEKVDVQILPQPIPPAAQAGIEAAETKKEQGADVHQQAVAAAGISGSYEVGEKKSQQEAKDMATQVAEYVAHKDSLPIDEAKAEAEKAVVEAIKEQGGRFVDPKNVPDSIKVHQREMKNQGKDCWAACGSKSGYCPSFCGMGACCRKMEKSPVPECQVATNTERYECVAPANVFPGAVRNRQADSNSTFLVVDAGPETVEEGVQGVGIGFWMIGLALVLACLVCCGGWCLFSGAEKKTKGQTRTAGVILSKSDGEDLELQEPLAASGVPGSRAIGEAPVAPAVAPAPAYRYVAGSSQGYMAAPQEQASSSSAVRPMVAPARSLTALQAGPCAPCRATWDQFDRIDTNHDGVLSRAEWAEAIQAPLGPMVVNAHPGASQDSFVPRQATVVSTNKGPMMMEPTTH